MHPLRHPRNAALVGIIFVIIGVLYWPSSLAAARRNDDADHPRSRDGVDGVCPRPRGLDGRVISTASARADAVAWA